MIVQPVLKGGLGNCLFCIATSLAYAFKHNINYCFIPTKIENPHYEGQQVFHSTFLNYADIDQSINTMVYNEPFFHYQEIPYFNCEKLVLNGYWQSEKYFSEYRNEIIKMLNIPYDYNKRIGGEGFCSIQVRRGDYLNLPNVHPVVTNDYLEKAQTIMRDKGVRDFLVFSDDIDWCYNNMFMFDDCTYGFTNKGTTEIDDLSAASSCQFNISSNSSFGWWIYWLNQSENKVGIFPKKWFGESLNHDTKDLYMPSMILL